MATNLHTLIRYRTIDRCLRNVDYPWSWEELSKACSKALKDQMKIEKEISRRTIMYDIKNMRSGTLGYEAPIEYDRKEKSYYYSNPKFSIDHIPIKKEELDELNNALLILRQFSGKESIKGLQNIVTKLEETLKIKRGRRTKEIIQFDHSLNEPGQQWVNRIYEAIKNKQSLSINYKPFDKPAYQRIISPYLLKEYNNRWFLFGYSHQYESITNLGLDRIVSIRKALVDYYIDPSFDEKSYLRDIIGVMLHKDVPKQTILIKAYGSQRLYIQTKWIHESQKTVEMTDDYGVFSLELIPNFELESKILSFGERVEVLEPVEFRELIFGRIEEALNRYVGVE